jgi:hypothetical protein
MTQSTNPKENVEVGSSTKRNSATDNTRNDAVRNQLLRSSAMPKRPRKTIVPRIESHQDAKMRHTSHASEETVQVTMSGLQPP